MLVKKVDSYFYIENETEKFHLNGQFINSSER